MSEPAQQDTEPAPRRPHPILKGVELIIEHVLFNSRWLMAPFYLGLVIALVALLYKFVVSVVEFVLHTPTA